MASVLSAKHFHDEQAAYEFVEARIWAAGRVCPHCGVVDQSGKLNGKSTRVGVYKCYACRKPFTVKVKTIFEDSHVKMHLWLQAIFLICSSKKGISSNQLHRTLGVTLKTAWFMSHRIREALKDTTGGIFGGNFGGVEADETFIGVNPAAPQDHLRGFHHMNRVMTLIDRDSGAARSIVMTEWNAAEVAQILKENVAKEAYLLTDEAGSYKTPGKAFTFHGSTNHASGEYVRKDAPWVHTNTVEGYFSVFKRGMRGVYQHCKRKHLHRYMAEFDFRYSNRIARGVDDVSRADKALMGVVGKRLTYQTAGVRA